MNANPAPFAWLVMMIFFVIPPFLAYLFTGDILKKRVKTAFAVVIAIGIALIPLSYQIFTVRSV